MTYTEFLIAPITPTSFTEAVNDLIDRSTVFVDGWMRGDLDAANRASKDVNKNFDTIIGDLMRARDDISNNQTLPNPSFIQALSVQAGKMVMPVTTQDQANVRVAGMGNGTLPSNSQSVPATLAQVLNKIKHQNTNQANFRIDGAAHILVITANKGGRPDCILEFDVKQFCALCKAAHAAL